MAVQPLWDTASEGDDAHTKPGDLATLGAHKAQCSTASGRWVALRMGAGQLGGFLSARLVSTAAVLAALVAALLIWL
jgi:hypothetical protein